MNGQMVARDELIALRRIQATPRRSATRSCNSRASGQEWSAFDSARQQPRPENGPLKVGLARLSPSGRDNLRDTDQTSGRPTYYAASSRRERPDNPTDEGVSLDAPEHGPGDATSVPAPEFSRPARGKMHADEVDIDAGLVARLVALQFPAWADLPVEEVASAGTVNAIYRLGPELMVRLPRAHTYTTDVHDDLQVLVPLAGRLPLEIPTIEEMGLPAEGYPFVWGIYRWIEGQAWSTGPPDDLDQASDDLAAFVIALQGLDPTGARPGYRGGPLVNADKLMPAAIAEASKWSPGRVLTRVWERSLSVPEWSGPPTWFHGDLLPTNLVVTAGRLRGIIDFGCCGVGNSTIEYSTASGLFDAEVRRAYRRALAVDDDTWVRARGWALVRGITGYLYYRETNPEFAAIAGRTLQAVLADFEAEGFTPPPAATE